MFKLKPLLQDMLPDENIPRGCYGSGKSSIERFLDEAKYKDDNYVINIRQSVYSHRYDYERNIINFHEIKNGKYKFKYPNITIGDFKENYILAEYHHKVGKNLEYTIIGTREELKTFFTNEKGYTLNEFDTKFYSEYEYANKDVSKIIIYKCLPKKLDDFKLQLKSLKEVTSTPDISYNALKSRNENSFSVKYFGQPLHFKIEISGKQCEVDFILDSLKKEQQSFLTKKEKPIFEYI